MSAQVVYQNAHRHVPTQKGPTAVVVGTDIPSILTRKHAKVKHSLRYWRVAERVPLLYPLI